MPASRIKRFFAKFLTGSGIAGVVLSLLSILKSTRPWRLVELGGDVDFIVNAVSYIWSWMDYGLVQLLVLLVGLALIWKAEPKQKLETRNEAGSCAVQLAEQRNKTEALQQECENLEIDIKGLEQELKRWRDGAFRVKVGGGSHHRGDKVYEAGDIVPNPTEAELSAFGDLLKTPKELGVEWTAQLDELQKLRPAWSACNQERRAANYWVDSLTAHFRLHSMAHHCTRTGREVVIEWVELNQQSAADFLARHFRLADWKVTVGRCSDSDPRAPSEGVIFMVEALDDNDAVLVRDIVSQVVLWGFRIWPRKNDQLQEGVIRIVVFPHPRLDDFLADIIRITNWELLATIRKSEKA